MQKGRLVYIEPNDVVKDYIKIHNGNHKNFTWNPEDFNMYVDLQVVCPSRNDCGEEQQTNKEGSYSNSYISLMEGVKIGKNTSLTTDYTNISYSEIKNNNVSSKEALGITSIDITFDAHFYPKVTINFTDVRAYSLFMPAEEQYKEELKSEAYKKGIYHDEGRAYTNFFSAVFHFPYPRFLLTVKGFYGTKVTFILAVETFKSALNSNTGNFDVSISFIGYMYGLYTDIPMNYIMCAPYIGTLSESSNSSLIKSEYWNDRVSAGVFKTRNGEDIPTFLEFARNYAKALINVDQNKTVGENFTRVNNARYLKSEIDDIILKYKHLILEDFAFNNENEKTYEKVIEGKKYTFFIFVKNNEENIKVNWSTDKRIEVSNLIQNANKTYSDIIDKDTISLPWICTYTSDDKQQKDYGKIYGKLSDVLTITSEDSKTIVKVNEPKTIKTIGFNESGETYSYDMNEEDTRYLKQYVEDNITQGIAADISKYYFCAINLPETITSLDNLRIKSEGIINNEQNGAIEEVEKYISEQLGFTPNIENIFRMVFAHLECFFNAFLDKTIYEIKRKNRKLKDFKPKLDNTNTDVKYKDKNGDAFLPPFFAYYEFKDKTQQKELAYPNMYDIHEIKFIDDLINASKQFAEQYNKIVQEIELLSQPVTVVEEEEDIVTSDIKLPISFNDEFTPSSYYDAFYGGKNPYSYIDKSSKTFIKDIFYAFCLRYYSLTSVEVKINTEDFIANEVNNVLQCFPDLDQKKISTIFHEGKDKVFDDLLLYSQKRIFPIEKMKFPSELVLNSMLFLIRMNVGNAYCDLTGVQNGNLDSDRTIFLNSRIENTFHYLKGIHVVNSSYFDVFNNLTSSINNLQTDVVYDNIKYISENTGVAKGSTHKLYKFIEENNQTYYSDKDVNQLAEGEELNEYTLPFILWGNATMSASGEPPFRKVSNLLYDLVTPNCVIKSNDGKKIRVNGDNSITDVAKAYYILASLIANIKDVRESFASNTNNNFIFNNDIFYNKITRTRMIIPLFYGCLLYLLRKKIMDNVDVVPYLFQVKEIEETDPVTNTKIKKIDPESLFVVYYNCFGNALGDRSAYFNRFPTNSADPVADHLRKLILTLVVIHSKEKIYDVDFATTITPPMSTSTTPTITIKNKDLISIFENMGGESELEKYFYDSLREGGIIKEILVNADLERNDVITRKLIIKHTDGIDDTETFDNITLYKNDSKTSKSVMKLLTETVCMISTNYKDYKTIKPYQDYMKEQLNAFYDKLYNSATGTTETQTTTKDEITNPDNVINIDIKRSLYYVLKNLYDKWVCSYGDLQRFKLNKVNDDIKYRTDRFKKGLAINDKSEINNFLFVDSLYRDIGEDFLCDPASLVRISHSSFDGTNNFSLYQFLHAFCQENKLMMRAIPVYNNFYTEEGLKEIFTPLNPFNINQAQENGFSSTYLIMYTHQPSYQLDKEDSEYHNDGIYVGNDISRTIVTQETLKTFNGEGYVVPTFGVTYGMQNQSYFKSININMDNPITTDYSIANTLRLATTTVSGGDLNQPLGIGQNIYSIYSNRSYNCTVEMVGCINIMPMMYFQLNNIPMFKGVYMIVSVKHSIRAGNMTTTFTGVRQTSIIYPFINGSLILSSMLDRSNGPITQGNTLENINVEGGNPTVSVLTPKVYSDMNVIMASVLEESWLKDQRDAYMKNKNVTLSNSYYGVLNTKKNKAYPLTYRKSRKVDFIILHYTAGASSANETDATSMRNGWFNRWQDQTIVSADFGVYDNGVVQFNPDLSHYTAWSVEGNNKGISIEICSTYDKTGKFQEAAPLDKHTKPNQENWKFSSAVLENTKKLIIELFKIYGAKNITTHYRRSGKECPGIWGWNKGSKYDMKGKLLTGQQNTEDELNNFITQIRTEWARVAQIDVKEAENMIKLV